jgi:hypothetical protein
MVWPTTRVSPEHVSGRTYDGTILGTFYHKGGVRISDLFSRRFSVNTRKEILSSLTLYSEFPEDILWKISKAKASEIRRLVQLWRGMEDSILISTPELVNNPLHPLHLKLWRWCITTAIHSYDHCASEWKKLCLHVKHLTSNSRQLRENDVPRSLPGNHNGGLSPIWMSMLPWLKAIYIANACNSAANKDVLARAGTFAQHRQLPAPPITDKRFGEEVLSWISDLQRIPVWDVRLEQRTDAALRSIVKNLNSKDLKPNPHISLSASACAEATRQEGGRAVSFMAMYLQEYVCKAPKVTFSGLTWLGAPYEVREGVPRVYTMCRTQPLHEDIKYFLSSSFRDESGEGTPLQVMFSGDGSHVRLEEPIFGLDEELPQQLFQLAIELCIENHYLKGSTYENLDDLDSIIRIGTTPIHAKAHLVNEPGNKVRWVTMECSYVTVALQPLAHWLAGVISHFPSLNSAFNRSYKGWDASIGVSMWEHPPSADHGFGVYDLTGASNNLNRNFLRHCGRTIINCFSNDGRQRRMLLLLLELLLQDREISIYKSQIVDGKREPAYLRFTTSNGVLMGNPGTKELLCLSSAVLTTMVQLSQRTPIYTLIAGDDVFVHCTLRAFDELLRLNTEYGNVINVTKTIWSQFAVFFCEEVVAYRPTAIGAMKLLWQMPYESHCHVDIIKLRLLSPFGIQSMMADDQFKNPAVGKAGALKKVLDWYPNAQMAWVALRRFLRWMGNFIRHDPLVFLPRSAGGHGIPYIGDREELLERILTEVDPGYFRIFEMMHSGGYGNSSIADLLLRRMAAGNGVRGIVDPSSLMLVSQYAALAVSSFNDQLKSFTDLEAMYEEKFPNKPHRAKDILAFSKKIGYMGYHDIAHNLDRLTLLRVGFAVASGNISPEEVLPPRNGPAPSPKMVLEKFYNVELPCYREYGFRRAEFSTSATSFQSFIGWFRSGMPEWQSKSDQIFIPCEALIDSLNGMQVKMPYRPPKGFVKGSIEDPDVAPSEGYTARIITLNRV